MEIELQNIKGTKDFLPEEQVIRNRITDILKQNFEKYGYLPLETPILNAYDLLKYKYGLHSCFTGYGYPVKYLIIKISEKES